MCTSARFIMWSRAELISQISTSYTLYTNQKGEEKGSNNLFVGGNADDEINNTADYSVILAGGGDDKITSLGNGNKIEGNDGNDKFWVIGNNNKVSGNNGNDTMLGIGNYNDLEGNNGDNSIVFHGDNINVTTVKGANYIASLDFAIIDGYYAEYASYIESKTEDINKKNQLIKTTENLTKEISRTTPKTTTEITGVDIVNQLPANEKALLKTIDLNAQINGKPRYVIAKSGQDGAYHIYDCASGTYRSVSNTRNILVIPNNGAIATHSGQKETTTSSTATYQDYTREDYADISQTIINGNENVNVKADDGDNTIKVNISSGNVVARDGDKKVNVVNGIKTEAEYSNQYSKEILVGTSYQKPESNTQKTPINIYIAGGSSYTYTEAIDPLVIDFNQDGKVATAIGKGIDLDGNGTLDGAAANGDKMLAMTDLNGNGSIDGQEVFGDRTIDPFSGKALNAENGFEALRMVAESAQAATGIKCIDEKGLVDLKALNKALQTKGIKLGFVSDDNNSQVEDLTKVAYIDTKNYENKQETGPMQHNQQGISIFEDGSTAKAHDVWFELTDSINPFDFAKLRDLLN